MDIPYSRHAEAECSKYVSSRNRGESLAQGEENKMSYQREAHIVASNR